MRLAGPSVEEILDLFALRLADAARRTGTDTSRTIQLVSRINW